jgi:UDP-N-acetylmuramoylalanine--D-glutamate ligase
MINLDFVKDKRIVVFGLGKAGASSVRALTLSGASVVASDDFLEAMVRISHENIPGLIVTEHEFIDWDEVDILVLSPGIPYTHPNPHAVVIEAKEAGCEIICDIELLYLANPKSKFIGITGTNGKSTTTALTGHILKEAGIMSAVGGNIGVPALDLENLGSEGTYVVEMSSYQLDLINKTRFNISVWLNITPDHLDRHGSIEGYIKAKKHIFDNNKAEDIVIIGIDDSFSLNVYEELKSHSEISKIIPISVNEDIQNGISLIDNILKDNYEGSIELNLGDVKKLQGRHNAQNIAAAYAITKYCDIGVEDFVQGVKGFDGLPHRMQYIKEENGVVYINDSKATNAEAASKALATFNNIFWIAGGIPKSGGIEALSSYFPKIRHAYLIGTAQDEFAFTLMNKVNVSKCHDLEEAFAQAKKDAESYGEDESVVLLSPACASFDQWPNFEARGEAFIAFVNE